MDDEGESSNMNFVRASHQRVGKRMTGHTTSKPEDLSFFPPNVDAYNIFPMK